ncbi:hypothetical protein CC86DRAFT_414058 [Ophiobolus disseminans]|uniref:Uncharacterized protein n=1 Tax=Ophiobolus disseminans TaxID=1469910 RepID=A0A6A6ZBB2_9PLEO|nr:hypothetical protein CC86DRAFT_414058 [Ophiobolus disseminans]
MAANADRAPPHENGHLIYTGKDLDNITRLYIHVDRRCTGPHTCNSFRPISATGTMEILIDTPSAKYIMEELGWFGDVALFTRVCQQQQNGLFKSLVSAIVGAFTRMFQNRPVPQQQNGLFNTWVSAVIGTLREQHSALWKPNKWNKV